MKSLYFALLMLLASLSAQASNVRVALKDGHGVLEGLITPEGRFRLSRLNEEGPREFRIGGKLFEKMKFEQIVELCQDLKKFKVPKYLSKTQSLSITGRLFPYTKEDLESLLQAPAETFPIVYKVEPNLSIASGSLTVRAAFYSGEAMGVYSRLGSQFQVDPESVARGEPTKFDLTGDGNLVCDFINGDATLTWSIHFRYPGPLLKTFVPLTSSQVSSLNDSLLSKLTWNRDSKRNLILGAAALNIELQALGVTSVSPSVRQTDLDWNYRNLDQILQMLLPGETLRPQPISPQQAAGIEISLTKSGYETYWGGLDLNTKIIGGK